MEKTNTRKIACLGMITALSYLVMVIGRVPLLAFVPFLKYDPKDVIIAIAGFIYGPLSSLIIAITVSLLEMFTVSETGFWGLLMNIISTCSFACIAALIYKKWHTLKGAVASLLFGLVTMVTLMLAWNFFITPVYMGQSREAIAKMLLPVFLPFNLIKGSINAALTMLLYKPVVNVLRKTRFISPSKSENKAKLSLGAILLSTFILVTCIIFIILL